MKNLIIFAPGWSGLPSKRSNPLLKRFYDNGYDTISLKYHLGGIGSIRKTAKNCKSFIETFTIPYDHTIFIGHSMGGLVGRYMIQELGFSPDAYVSLATPHKGSPLAKLAPPVGLFGASSDIAPGSALLSSLKALEWPQIPSLALQAMVDFLVPCKYAKFGPTNQKIPWTEHLTILSSERTFLEIWGWLEYGVFSPNLSVVKN